MVLDSRLTQEVLSTLFYIKDDELYWRERDQKDFERSVVFFNNKFANKVAGVTSAYGIRKVGVTVSKGVNIGSIDVEDIKSVILTGNMRERTCISDHPYFHVWNSMRCRCGVLVNYLDVKLSDEFSTFNNFITWAEKQKGYMSYDSDGKIYEIDKDILSGGSGKVYSKEFCVFVPRVLNLLVYQKRRTDLPKGVQYFPEKKKPYRAYMTNRGRLNHYGYYHTIEEASSVVRKERFKYIQELEMEYKNLVDDRVFPAIYKLNESW